MKNKILQKLKDNNVYTYICVCICRERDILLLLLLFCLNWSELGWCMLLELQKVLKMMSIFLRWWVFHETWRFLPRTKMMPPIILVLLIQYNFKG